MWKGDGCFSLLKEPQTSSTFTLCAVDTYSFSYPTNKDFYHAQGFLGTILPIMHGVPGLDQRGTDESWEWYQYRRNLESEKKLNNVVWSWSRSASWLTSTGILETATLEKYSNDQVYNSCFFNCSDTHRFADLFGKIPELGRFLVQNILIKFFLDEFDLQQHVLNTNLWKKERDTTGWATGITCERNVHWVIRNLDL